MWRIVSSEGESVPVTVLRAGKEITVMTKPIKEKTGALERKSLREIGISALQTPLVARVNKNSPAAVAGLQPNDIILEANGVHLYSPAPLTDINCKNTNSPGIVQGLPGDRTS